MKVFADGILQNRVAFVTGGGTGITGGVARALAEAGANVALVSRSIEHLEPAATAINDLRGADQGTSPTNRGSHTGARVGLSIGRDHPLREKLSYLLPMFAIPWKSRTLWPQQLIASARSTSSLTAPPEIFSARQKIYRRMASARWSTSI